MRRERLSTLGKTVATVSHEMRNPLATVRNALFSIREALAKGEAGRAERAMDLAERNVRRCDLIIHELLDYSRPRPAVPEATEIDSWLAAVLDELEPPQGIEVQRTLASGAWARIDAERLRRAVVNVHLNAVQAMEGPRGGTLCVESSYGGGQVHLVFRDSGEGMGRETLERAEEPLFSTKPFGVGLGLSIVRGVMEEHGGSLSIESQEGNGTVVTLRLPALEHEAQP
jgi:signal transduction histidine kinase